MKTILIPTDFSENARNAIAYIVQLYKDSECTFHFLHSYAPPVTEVADPVSAVVSTEVLLQNAKEEAEKGLKQTVQWVSEMYPDKKHTYTTHHAYDFFLGAVKSFLDDNEVDLIVMGTKGASGLKEVMLGSNTASIIGHTQKPVLVIPEKAVFRPIREIAFATDYDQYLEKYELNVLMALAKKSKAPVRVVYCQEKLPLTLTKDQENIKGFLNEVLKTIPHSFHALTGVDVETGTRVFTQSRDIDLLCMMTKKHGFFDRLWGKPKVEEISFHVKIPFLVLNMV